MDDCAIMQMCKSEIGQCHWVILDFTISQFLTFTISLFHKLHVIQDRSCLKEAAEEFNGEAKMFVSGYARFVSLRLAEGRRPKGRGGVRNVECKM